MVPYLLPRPGAAIEEYLFYRGICLGADGSVLQDGCRVYAVHAELSCVGRLHTIDYFHWFFQSIPLCQTVADKLNFLAADLIAANRNGYVVCRLRRVQLQFRARRAKR